MIIGISDTHFKGIQPYWNAQKNFLEYLNQYNNPDTHLIFYGDIFDGVNPHWDIVDIIMNFLSSWRGKKYIVHGNHEKKVTKGSCLEPLKYITDCIVVKEHAKFNIDGIDFWLLPFTDNEEIKKEYESIIDPCDYVISHMAPVKTNFGSDEINLQIPARAYFWGHIHGANDFIDTKKIQNHIQGVPIVTRDLEQNFDKRIISFQKNSYEFIALPKFLDIEVVIYGQEPENKNNLLKIVHAPSVKDARNKYKEFPFIKSIDILRTDIKNETVELSTKEDNKIKFNKFAIDEAISQELRDITMRYL